MGFWGGMGGGGGNWGGGNWGGNWNQPPNQQNRDRDKDKQGPQGLRRSVDAWDDNELGAAYNHAVVMRLLSYIKPYKFRATLAVIGVLGWAILQALEPLFIGRVIDAATDGDAAGALLNGLIFLGLVLGFWAAQYMKLLNAGWIGHKILQRLRVEMFAHLQKLSLR